MKFLIMGAGSIGERHLKNLRILQRDSSIHIFDPQQNRLSEVCKRHEAIPIDHDAIDRTYDCVFICTPPISHIELAKRALAAGSNVFIEKPLSSNLNGVKELARYVNKKRLLAFVAYNFRFNKGIGLVKDHIRMNKYGNVVHASAYFGQYLPDWRPWQDYRKGYTANRSLGGGIIHDGSHEINYLTWILGEPSTVQANVAFTDILAADTEAIADVLLKFGNIPAYIHLDFVRREYRRSVEFLCENGIIQWSLAEDIIRTFDGVTKKWTSTRLNENVNDMYFAELAHVMDCIKSGSKSEIIDLENGISTLRVSDAIEKSGMNGRRLLL